MRFGGYAAPTGYPDPAAEKELLKNQAEALQSELSSVHARLAQMENKGDSD